jgi:predicted nucleic acid-binding protein
LEVLVGPLKTGNTRLEAGFRALLLGSTDVKLIPISQQVLERAAKLRAAIGLKTPDAIHAATALEYRSASFITNDPAFGRVTGLSVQVLNDLLTP